MEQGLQRLEVDVLALIRGRVEALQRRADELQADNERLRARDVLLRHRLHTLRRSRDLWKQRARDAAPVVYSPADRNMLKERTAA